MVYPPPLIKRPINGSELADSRLLVWYSVRRYLITAAKGTLRAANRGKDNVEFRYLVVILGVRLMGILKGRLQKGLGNRAKMKWLNGDNSWV